MDVDLNFSSKDFRTEICFLLDITGSMNKYVKGVQESLKLMFKGLKEIFPKDLAISICGYRDKTDSKTFEYLDFIEFTQKEAESGVIIDFLENIECTGGNDEAEDIRQGIKDSIAKLQWKTKKRRYIILIADSPCHGKRLLIRTKKKYFFFK